MWQDLDGVQWAKLEHNYGDAANVPAVLRACADRDAGRALDALAELDNLLFHRGCWVCSAASASLPFLLDLALDQSVYHRSDIVELIGRIAREATRAEPRLVDPGWRDALQLAVPRILTLLASDDLGVRREASLLVAAGGLPLEVAVSALWERWQEETDPVTRWDLVLALGDLAAKHPDTADIRSELHRLVDHHDLQVRLAAVHALDGLDPDIAAAHVAMLAEAVLHHDAEGWQHSAWIGGTRGTIIHATGQLLHRNPAAATAFTIGVNSSTDIDQQIATLAQAGQLLAEWRTTTAALLPFLSAHLRGTTPEIRYRAAFLLGCLGSDSTAHADRLAELTDDMAMRDSRRRYTVGDVAVWALARQHDPRCVPGLIRRLTGDRLGFGAGGVHSRDEFLFSFWHPGIEETLAPLKEHAGDLVDAVAMRIASASDSALVSRLCGVLAAWGPAAGSAVPVLVPLLADDERWQAAAGALGSIGSAAELAGDALLRRATADPGDAVAPWAHWRVTGASEPAAAVLVRMTAGEVPPSTLRRVADLGPRAAAAEHRLRQLTESADEWTRVEAAHAHWRASGNPSPAVNVLTEIVRPLTQNRCSPVMRAAMRYLAEIGAPAAPAAPIAQAVLDNPRRLAYFGSWRTFTEDEELRSAAATVLAPLHRDGTGRELD
jgi:hypothetical protein